MDAASNYVEINKKLWNERTGLHVGSAFYDMEAFLAGKSSLKQIELDLLGDVAGKSVLHLQCHFGQDTLSLARMGADVTGVDLSDRSICKATELSQQLGLPAKFICCDIYDLPQHLDREFDIVFTTYGTVGWLPDLSLWANLIARYLKPGGELIFADFHPVVWMFNSAFTEVEYSYFNKDAIVETEQGTYTDKSAPIALESVGWNHSLDEVLQNLLNAGLIINEFREYDYSPYDCFANMKEVAPGKYHITSLEGKLPLVYSIRAVKE
jgi:SAM-dependent methyltransferase